MLAPSDTQSLITQAAAEFAEADRLETLAAANLVEATLHRLAGARLLSKIKHSGDISHGQWLAWLKSRFTLKPRTLQEYMELAEYYPPAKAQRVAHLGVKGMLALMRKERGRRQYEQKIENGCTVDDLHGLITDGREFSVIYADPRGNSGWGNTRPPDTMTPSRWT